MSTAKKIRGPEVYYQSEEEKNVIERAAYFSGVSPTAFIRAAALQAAQDKIENSRKLVLSDKDFEGFVSNLETGSEPTKSLKKLMKS